MSNTKSLSPRMKDALKSLRNAPRTRSGAVWFAGASLKSAKGRTIVALERRGYLTINENAAGQILITLTEQV